ncbi:cytochrome c551/c552 [Acidovorax temperans]|uniref:Cytochrome c551/c552 n=1 Tax=Acidovorax temperans TaxID=80878 RepID=A0A543L930_9BURK|nr:c-type cytochrome [Acidovorax temperans]TQN03779.1 cytochrome c551/c552 [Acidovorax temperans]
MHPDDDIPPPRPRWLGWALIAFGLLVALGMLNLGVRMVLSAKPPQTEAPQPPSAATPVTGAAEAPQTSSLAGQALVQASDCLRCHGMDRRYVGPSFRQIADRYREQPDAANYLARKIREGSVGVWGRTVMPRHPQVNEAQSSDMARWLLSLPPAQAAAPQ